MTFEDDMESAKKHDEYMRVIQNALHEAVIEGIYAPWIVHMSPEFFLKASKAYSIVTGISVIEKFHGMTSIDGSYACCIVIDENGDRIRIEKWNRIEDN